MIGGTGLGIIELVPLLLTLVLGKQNSYGLFDDQDLYVPVAVGNYTGKLGWELASRPTVPFTSLGTFSHQTSASCCALTWRIMVCE